MTLYVFCSKKSVNKTESNEHDIAIFAIQPRYNIFYNRAVQTIGYNNNNLCAYMARICVYHFSFIYRYFFFCRFTRKRKKIYMRFTYYLNGYYFFLSQNNTNRIDAKKRVIIMFLVLFLFYEYNKRIPKR